MIRQINGDMAKIYAWVNANKLFLKIDKIYFMPYKPRVVFIVQVKLLYKPI